MSQEWGQKLAEMVPEEPGAVAEEGESINLKTNADYFRECEANRELLQTIRVVVPVRPTDGTNNRLAQKLSVWYGEGTPWSHLNDHMGGFIEATRANIAYNFKNDNTGAKYLIMIDNDMEPPLNLPYLLARHNRAIVGAPAMAVSLKHGPQLCFTVKDVEGNYRFPTLASQKPIPAVGLKRAGHVGTGAICIRKDVMDSFSFSITCRNCGWSVPYEEVDKCEHFGEVAEASFCKACGTIKHMYEDIPFFVPLRWRMLGMRTGQICLGEDISFCNQVRAKGFQQYVDLEAHCGHRKMMGLTWDDSFRDSSMDAESWVIPTDGKRITST